MSVPVGPSPPSLSVTLSPLATGVDHYVRVAVSPASLELGNLPLPHPVAPLFVSVPGWPCAALVGDGDRGPEAPPAPFTPRPPDIGAAASCCLVLLQAVCVCRCSPHCIAVPGVC